MSAAPCASFGPRSARDLETCATCGWSRAAHSEFRTAHPIDVEDEPPSTDRPAWAIGFTNDEVFRPGGILDQRAASRP
jgi:hypothetical protein